MTGIDRRAFLRRLGFGTVAAAAAASDVFDVERLLWVPGEKTLVVPSGLASGHTFVTADWITEEVLRVLEKNLAFTAMVNRHYHASFRVTG